MTTSTAPRQRTTAELTEIARRVVAHLPGGGDRWRLANDVCADGETINGRVLLIDDHRRELAILLASDYPYRQLTASASVVGRNEPRTRAYQAGRAELGKRAGMSPTKAAEAIAADLVRRVLPKLDGLAELLTTEREAAIDYVARYRRVGAMLSGCLDSHTAEKRRAYESMDQRIRGWVDIPAGTEPGDADTPRDIYLRVEADVYETRGDWTSCTITGMPLDMLPGLVAALRSLAKNNA